MTVTGCDVTKDLERYRARRGQFKLLEVPGTPYLMVDGAGDPNTSTRWHWRLLMMTPPWLTAAHVEEHLEDADDVRWETFDEGLCLQTLHIGPYDAEGPLLARMHDEEIPARGLALAGLHHEIYLGDPRRAAPEKLRTILRQPVTRAATAEDEPGRISS